jgi:mannose/fructose/N-acetylgalactosamine-specific phosphotransferase system component IID
VYAAYKFELFLTGPAFVAAIISLLANLCLIGGAKQYSKEIILFWIIWKVILIVIYWLWYGYSQGRESTRRFAYFKKFNNVRYRYNGTGILQCCAS